MKANLLRDPDGGRGYLEITAESAAEASWLDDTLFRGKSSIPLKRIRNALGTGWTWYCWAGREPFKFPRS